MRERLVERSTGGTDARGEALAEAVEARLRTGRPLAEPEWIAHHEATLDGWLAPQRPVRKARAEAGK